MPPVVKTTLPPPARLMLDLEQDRRKPRMGKARDSPEGGTASRRVTDRVFRGYRVKPACTEVSGGQREIRTLDTREGIHAFQACALNHSAICPANAQQGRRRGRTIVTARRAASETGRAKARNSGTEEPLRRMSRPRVNLVDHRPRQLRCRWGSSVGRGTSRTWPCSVLSRWCSSCWA